MELAGKRGAILTEEFYEGLELWHPALRLRQAGAEVKIIGGGSATTYASKHGYPVTVDAVADEVSAGDFDALIVPGGYAPDKLRRYPAVLALVRQVFEQGQALAMICHAAWAPISAGILKGRTATCVPAHQGRRHQCRRHFCGSKSGRGRQPHLVALTV